MNLNIWYVNHYAALPNCGRGERPLNIARELISGGHRALIVCAGWHHLLQTPPPPEALENITLVDGLSFWHVPVRKYTGNGLGRVLNMLDFVRGLKQLMRAVDSGRLAPPDVIIVSSPHPIAFKGCDKIAQRYGASIVFEERDIWPQSLVSLGGVSPRHPVVLWMGRHVRKAYRRADAVVSLLPKATDFLVSQGARRSAVHYIPNGASPDRWRELNSSLPAEHQAEFDRLRALGKFIVVYAGAHGDPNALEQLLSLGDAASGTLPYHFVLIGDGAAKPVLMEEAARRDVSWISFLPSISKSAIPAALGAADAGFIALKDSPLFDYGVSPNKLFDYFMAAIPVIFAVRSGNRPVEEAQAGISVSPYDAFELDSAVRRLAALSAVERAAMGARGRDFVVERHSWQILGRRYSELCESLRRRSVRQAA